MPVTFDSLVDDIRSRSVEEKTELKFLLERELIGEHRREILVNAAASRREEKRGALKFSSKVGELRKFLA